MNTDRASNTTWGQTHRPALGSVASRIAFLEMPTMTNDEYRQALALFRYGLIADLIQLQIGRAHV